ncbi:hypothetical protein Fmac_008570 [Flemingia macrophylla]|uniref:Uncharacterized protein n=1 Tax=Flemingia macrophylla TaxID=520843 RepID=A0ABD1MXT7_9FABA
MGSSTCDVIRPRFFPNDFAPMSQSSSDAQESTDLPTFPQNEKIRLLCSPPRLLTASTSTLDVYHNKDSETYAVLKAVMKNLCTKKTSASSYKTKNGSFNQVPTTPNNHSSHPSSSQPTHHGLKLPPLYIPTHYRTSKKAITMEKNNSRPLLHARLPQPTLEPPPPLVHQSTTLPSPTRLPRTLKLRLSSTNKTNSTPQLNLPPLVESQFNSQPTHPPQSHSQPSLASKFGSQPISTTEPGSDFDSENETNEDVEIQQSQPVSRKRAWVVNVIDDQGTKNTKPLTVNDVWSLSPNERVVVEWNDEDQATADSGALLNRFLGHLARDSDIFPISYTS